MHERASGLSTAGVDEATVFRSLHAAYPDALLIVDGSGSIVLTNQAAESLLGYSSFELVGMNVDELVPDAIRARHVSYRKAYADNPSLATDRHANEFCVQAQGRLRGNGGDCA